MVSVGPEPMSRELEPYGQAEENGRSRTDDEARKHGAEGYDGS